MCKFKPFNKHILIEKIEEPKKETYGVLIPEDAKLTESERYGQVKFLCAASDCETFLLNLNKDRQTWVATMGTNDDVFTESAKQNGHISLVVDKTMIEHVTIQQKLYHIVHQNYVVGVLDE